MSRDPIVAGLPPSALVLLIGPTGAGKSTWARSRFDGAEILSSDVFREQVAGDAADQSANADAFKVLHLVAAARLRRGLRTVVDATNLTEGARRSLLRLARKAGRPAVAVAFDLALERCLAQNASRSDRRVPDEVVCRHHGQLAGALGRLAGEGYEAIHVLHDGDLRAV